MRKFSVVQLPGILTFFHYCRYEERARLEEAAQKELNTAEQDSARQIAQLQATIDELDAESADQIEYTDMCKSLARLLRVDVGSSAAATARELYHRVDTMLSEIDALKKSVRDMEITASRSQDLGLGSTAGWENSGRPALESSTTYQSSHGGSGFLTNRGDGLELERIRKSLVTQKLDYDKFVEEVSTALGVPKVPGEKANTALLVQRIVELMSEAPPPGSGATKSAKRGVVPRPPPSKGGLDKSGARHSRELRKQHEDLQRR